MSLETEAYEGELLMLRGVEINAGYEMSEAMSEINELRRLLDQYKNGYEAAMRIVKSTYPDKFPDTYFICGELGSKDDNGMPEKLTVCPAYGCDFFYIYERTGVTSGPEY